MAMYGTRSGSDFDLDAHFRDLAAFNAGMNDPAEFRKRKIAMMKDYELPKLQAEMQGRMGIQQEANKPALVRLNWEKSPDNYAQHKSLMAMQTQPAMNQVQLARDKFDYDQTPQALWRQEDLAKARAMSAPPVWGFNPYEGEYFNARNADTRKAAGPLGGAPFSGTAAPWNQAALPDSARKKYGPGSTRRPAGVARPSYPGDPDLLYYPSSSPVMPTTNDPYSPYDEESDW